MYIRIFSLPRTDLFLSILHQAKGTVELILNECNHLNLKETDGLTDFLKGIRPGNTGLRFYLSEPEDAYRLLAAIQ